MMIEDKLKKANIGVVTLRESKDAMVVIKKEMPDLIILDWMMSELSGIELCRMLKEDPDMLHIPIFMLTAKGQDADEQLGLIGIAGAMGMGKEMLEKLRICSLLHDIGKIATPKEILNKAGKLDAAEWDEMKRHPGLGPGYSLSCGSSAISSRVLSSTMSTGTAAEASTV